MKKEPRITLLSEFAPILNTKKGLITMYQTYSTNMAKMNHFNTKCKHLSFFENTSKFMQTPIVF